MKMKKALLMMLLLALAAGILFLYFPQTTGTQPGNGRQVILGFAQLGSESGWRIGNTRSVIQAAEKSGNQLMYKNAEQKHENQIKAIRSFIAYQVDVIAFAPIVEDGWENVLMEARDAGIPVICSDRSVNVPDESLVTCFVGSDFYAEGRRAAEYLIRKTQGQDGPVRIAEMSGTLDSTPMRYRALGFRETLGDDPRFRIVFSQSGDFLRSRGREVMENILSGTDGIDVLYSHNDAMTLGAIELLEERGLRPGKDIIIITVDGEQGAIDLLKQGKINCVVECTPMLGDMIMSLAKKLARGEEVPKVTYSQETVFSDFDPGLQSIPARGY